MQKRLLFVFIFIITLFLAQPNYGRAATVYVIAGADNSSPALHDIWKTTDMINWTTSTALFGSRYAHAGTTYLGNLLITGGFLPGTGIYSDAWRSINGTTWTQLNPTTNLLPVWEHAMATFAGKAWILGGSHQTGLTNEILSTINSTIWTTEPTPPWTARLGHTATAFNNKLYIIGGSAGNDAQTQEVWSLSNEMVWHKDAENIQAASRTRHTAIVFKKKLWVLGGVSTAGLGLLNDVWYTTNGTTWTQAPNAPWTTRRELQSVVLNGKLYIMGGTDWTGTLKNDIWSTTDGVSWVQETSAAPWSGRTDFVVLKK